MAGWTPELPMVTARRGNAGAPTGRGSTSTQPLHMCRGHLFVPRSASVAQVWMTSVHPSRTANCATQPAGQARPEWRSSAGASQIM
eukprot:350869-Chlamydomonas_euryale.AAC.4